MRTKQEQAFADYFREGKDHFICDHLGDAAWAFEDALGCATSSFERARALYELGQCYRDTSPARAQEFFTQARRESGSIYIDNAIARAQAGLALAR
jgi:hypothetical protein